MNRRFRFPLAAGALAATALLTTGALSQSNAVNITFWTAEMASYTPHIPNLIAQFEAVNPGVKVKWVDVPFGDVQTKLVQAISAKSVPDVVNLSYDWTHRFAAEGALMPLQKYLPPADFNSYLPNILSAMKYGPNYYALPYYLSTEVLLWNKELFKAAGLNPNRGPVSDAELIAFGKTIKAKTGKYAFMPTGTILGDPFNFLRSYGVPALSSDGKKAAFNTPKMLEALKFWKSAFDAGLMPEETPSAGFDEEVKRFGAGEIAMAITGPWFVGSQLIPNGFGIQKLGIGQYYGVPNAATMDLVVMSGSKAPAESAKFARFMTNDASMLAHAKFTNGTELPSTRAAFSDPYFNQKDTSTADPFKNAAFTLLKKISSQQMARAKISSPQITTARFDELSTALKDAIKASLLGQTDPAQAVKAAETTWNAILASGK
jgi:putative chitobiose transport system substrate-binding protein